MFGYYRVASAVPIIKVADCAYNVNQTVELLEEARAAGSALAVFPELGITGYSCADLFNQTTLLRTALDGLRRLREATVGSPMVTIVGAPLMHANRLYNCAVVLQDGAYRGIVPKSYLPTYREYYEKRWFTSGRDLRDATLQLEGIDVPFGVDLLFAGGDPFLLGIEVCEDLWAIIPPSSYQAMAGATLVANLSASVSVVAKHDYRRQLVSSQSARCMAGYVYAGAGVHESTTDVVYGGHSLIAENGHIVKENLPYQRRNNLIHADLDLERLVMTRQAETAFADHPQPAFRRIPLAAVPQSEQVEIHLPMHPFVPSDPAVRDDHCREIFQIQSAALARRLQHAMATSAVIGVSGGLDSTLALLVCIKAFELIDRDLRHIIAVTMPGYGTTDRTYRNAVDLCHLLGTEFLEIDIRPACEQHFADIGHDPAIHDTTYENVQARERTQLLMDIANKHGGLVIGTGDLSEIALGWSTYNGDHMSMYAVNCGVPKTLIRYVIGWAAEQHPEQIRNLLRDVLDTPITPELLPRNEAGQNPQHTEAVIGPYELHDFFLYHAIKYGATPAKIAWLASIAFSGHYRDDEIRKWLQTFLRRFFTNQFKRSCVPDGPKVGTISLSPRGDWRMPSDADSTAWLADLH